MKRLLGRIGVALCFCLFLSSAGYGKQLKAVYLKGGGIIDCQSFWKEGGKVMVLVNRDVLVDLPAKEVDMKRTFTVRKRAHARKPETAVSAATAAKPVEDGTMAKQGAAPADAVKQKTVSSAVKPATVTAVGAAAAPKGTQHASPAAKGPVVPAPAPVPRPVPKLHVPPPVSAPSPAVEVMAGMLSFSMLLPFLLIILILIVSLWRIFRMAGEAGWQAIIPLYNMFVLVKISGKPWWWFLLLFIPLVGFIILLLVNMALARRFDRGVLFGLGLTFLGFIFFPLLAFGGTTYRQEAY
jgi:hypothetical protein